MHQASASLTPVWALQIPQLQPRRCFLASSSSQRIIIRFGRDTRSVFEGKGCDWEYIKTWRQKFHIVAWVIISKQKALFSSSASPLRYFFIFQIQLSWEGLLSPDLLCYHFIPLYSIISCSKTLRHRLKSQNALGFGKTSQTLLSQSPPPCMQAFHGCEFLVGKADQPLTVVSALCCCLHGSVVCGGSCSGFGVGVESQTSHTILEELRETSFK